MTESKLASPWRGIYPPLVTPLVDRDNLDAAGLERLIEHVLSGGVHGLFILGTTGEAAGLSVSLRREMIQRVCSQVAGRAPVMVGITDTCVAESVNLARYAAEQGAEALVAAAPYYYPIDSGTLLEHYRHLAAEAPLPLFLYNMPSHTKVMFELEMVRQAMDIPGVIGIKDSARDMVYFHHLVRMARQRPDWTLLMGPEQLLAEAVLLGGHGGICGGANLCPRLYVELYEAAFGGDLERVRQLHGQVMDLAATLFAVGPLASAFIRGLKSALSLLDICSDFMAEPFHRFTPDERALILRHLEAAGIVGTEPWPHHREASSQFIDQGDTRHHEN